MGGTFGSAEVSAGVGWSESQASKDEVQLKKTTKNSIRVAAPGADGINHDEDKIYLWLNPQVNLEVSGADVKYYLTVPDPPGTMDVQYVYVRQLKHPETMPPGLANHLNNDVGLTANDYAEILIADPFGNGSTVIDSSRFVLTSMTFPYQPPLTGC